MKKALNYNELKLFSIENDLKNIDLNENTSDGVLIGQERAAKALEFGLNVKADGYNIYVSGPVGTGKTTFSKTFADNIAKNEPRPRDLCYIYNFKDPQTPRLLVFGPGDGKVFKEDMEDLINQLEHEIPNAFKGSDFENQKDEIVRAYQEKREIIIKDITDDAKLSGFGVKMTNSGIYFMPIVEGEIISEEEYDTLSDDIKSDISAKSELIQYKALEALRQINSLDSGTQREVEDLEYKVALFIMGRHVGKLAEKYSGNDKVLEYLSDVKEDLLENIVNFNLEDSDENETLQNLLPWVSKKNKDDFLSKYKVNLLTDNSSVNYAPVIVDYNPTYSNLVGEVEYDSEFGNFTTDYMKIKPGLLHKANGGYLILQVQDVISNPHVWETLKRVMRMKKLSIENTREYSAGITVAGIKPEPVDIDLKIILVGTSYYYELLYEYDDEFRKFFKIRAVFDYEMPYNHKSAKDVAVFIKDIITKNSNGFELSAVIKLFEYSMRMSENQKKLSTQLGKLSDIVVEASAWAKIDNVKNITGEYIKKAISEKEQRHNIYEEKLGELIDKNIVMIDTEGSKIAQINCLAVLDTGEYTFSKPIRITATTYVGKAGIINIEKEADMSGAIHDKGVEVLTGYLGQMYAQEFSLSLSCRVCFEQNYSGIDGDSASSTELYAILSSLSDVAIRQDIAVTGSVNQRGEIQAIGGVTYKIEGFFDLCEKRGLTGEQGVIIPLINKDELVLKDSVIAAVKEGKFHIYAISNIDEGIEILTGLPAGKKNEKGKYPARSIHGKAMKKLRDFHKKSSSV